MHLNFKDLFLGVAGAKLDDFEFPVKNIPTEVFQLVVDWLKEHNGKKKFYQKN